MENATALTAFRAIARNGAIERATKKGFLRNLATALGNDPRPEHAPALRVLAEHEDRAVRDHARWALARLNPLT